MQPGYAGPFKAERRHGHRPPLVQVAEHRRARDAGIGEEQLGEGLATGDRGQWSGLDAWSSQIDQETGDPVMLLRGRICSHVELAPIGEVTQRVPRLLPIDDEVVTVFDRSGAQRGEVRTGVGFGHALRPDLVAAQHGLEEALLLLRGAELHDRRRDVGDTDHVHRAWSSGAIHLL